MHSSGRMSCSVNSTSQDAMHSPIHLLPLELLMNILQRATSETSETTGTSGNSGTSGATGTGSFEYARVCKAWHAVAPLIHVSMHVRGDAKLSEASLFRSVKAFPLLTSLHLDEQSLVRLSGAFLTRVGAHIPRLEHLQIHKRAVCHGVSKLTSSSLSSLISSTPRLQSLRLCCSTPRDSLGFAEPDLLIAKRVPLQPPEAPAVYLEALPSSLWGLSSLTDLRIGSTMIRFLPEGLWGMPALTSLHLELPLLEEIPGGVGGLRSLRELQVHSAVITALPAELSDLEGLEALHLRCPALRRLPPGIQRMQNLRTLDITQCFHLRGHDAVLPTLASLTSLAVGHISQPALASLSKLPSLQVLRLCSYLGNIPEGFCACPSLKVLSLLYCWDLEGLPESFGLLLSLEELYIESCTLGYIPASLHELPRLRLLSMKQCPVGAKPAVQASLAAEAKSLWGRSEEQQQSGSSPLGRFASGKGYEHAQGGPHDLDAPPRFYESPAKELRRTQVR